MDKEGTKRGNDEQQIAQRKAKTAKTTNLRPRN